MKTLALNFLLLSALLLSVTGSALAQSAPMKPFPDDYKPLPCAPKDNCTTFENGRIVGAAHSFLGLSLDQLWLDDHRKEVDELFAPVCRKHATCLATPGNNFLFCDDIISPELRDICNKRFPQSGDKRDWEQCETYMEVWELGVDQNGKQVWEATLPCVEQAPHPKHPNAPIVWVDPPSIPRDYKGYVTIYAVDPDTHVPVQANIGLEGPTVYAPANPAGSLGTYYPFKLPLTYIRVPNANGHTDLVAPKVTILADGYPTVEFPLPTPMPKMTVEMKPAADKLKPGKNTITFSARDIDTGKPVEARVMLGDAILGKTNEPVTLELPKDGKHNEIWVTSLFNKYSDAVVVPAVK